MVRKSAVELESLGYATLWLMDGYKDPFVTAAAMLDAAERVAVATSIADVLLRHPWVLATSARTLGEAHPGRFVLGLAIGGGLPGEQEASPTTLADRLGHMGDYLDAMDNLPYWGPVPRKPVQRMLGAMTPEMLELAGKRSRGVLAGFGPISQTAKARELLGPEPVIAIQQPVGIGRSADDARALGRERIAPFLRQEHVLATLRELGWRQRDLQRGGSDAFLDAVVPHGGAKAVAERVQAHFAAGADHVSLVPLARDTAKPQVAQLRKVAAALSL